MGTKAWVRAILKIDSAPHKKKTVVWISKNNLLQDRFLVPNLVLMDATGKCGFLRPENLGPYVKIVGEREASPKLDRLWTQAASKLMRVWAPIPKAAPQLKVRSLTKAEEQQLKATSRRKAPSSKTQKWSNPLREL